MSDIENLGKGAVVQPEDPRDFLFEALGAAPVDWSRGVRLSEPPDENQGTSLSCVAQATSYLHWQLHRNSWSRRSVYSSIFLPQGGAYLRDGVKYIATKGQATRDEAPDPSPETETNMRNRSDITAEEEASDIEAGYFLVTDSSIEGIAQAVRDYQGCIFGVHGNDAGWADLTNPLPPASTSQIEWGHALYAFGYHLHDGVKCIIAKSSWCKPTHHEHHIKQPYFLTGMTFNGWAVVPKEEFMTNSILVKNGGEFGIYDPATSGDGLITLMRNRGMQTPLKPDGTLDFSQLTITKELKDIF
jgi:hypothetical protein